MDGQRIDPWHFASVLEGLRLRMDGALRLVDRGALVDAARHALALHQWLTTPGLAEAGEVLRAMVHLASFDDATGAPLLATACETQARFASAARARRSARPSSATGRTTGCCVCRCRSRARRPCAPRRRRTRRSRCPSSRGGLVDEAGDYRQMLYDLERTWAAARAALADRRRDSNAVAAADLLAAAPLLSATSLAGILGIAVKTATRLRDDLVAAGIAVEVTHRAKRWLFGLKGMAKLREVVRAPYRPETERGRGRPPILPVEEDATEPPPLPAQFPLERRVFDYSDLEHGLMQLDQVLRRTRRSLDVLAGKQTRQPATANGDAATAMWPADHFG